MINSWGTDQSVICRWLVLYVSAVISERIADFSFDMAGHVALLARAVVAAWALERSYVKMVPYVFLYVCDFNC